MANLLQFSIILPTYNREQFIVDTVNSILKQSFKEYEIILIDDGSTDNTSRLIKETFGINERVRYFYKENAERGAARNFGIKVAQAEYLVFLDSDDVMDCHYLENLNYYIKKYPECNFFGCKYDIVDTFGVNSSPVNDLKSVFYDYKLLLKGNVFACNICCKKTNTLIYFQENRSLASMEDWIFLIQNLKNDRLFLIPEVGIVMSDHIDRSMANNTKVIKARIEAMKFLIDNEKFHSEEKNMIKGYSYNFCAIHSYLDFNRNEALTYFGKFIKIRGIGMEMLVMGLKYLIGRKVVDKIPRGRASRIRRILTKELIEN